MKQLLTRAITAICLIAVLVVAELYAHSAPYLLKGFAAALWGAALLEFAVMQYSTEPQTRSRMLVGSAVFISVICILGIGLDTGFTSTLLALLMCGIAIILLVAGRAANLERAATIVFVSLLGIALFGLGGLGLARIVNDHDNNQTVSLWLLSLVIVTDIGGYVFGNLIKGIKLCPIISPGKTVAGALGATVLVVIAGPQVANALGTNIATLHSSLAALCIAIAAQSGDLMESLVKRVASVKDSGALLPGHGGAWDRIDGLLAAAAIFPFLVG